MAINSTARTPASSAIPTSGVSASEKAAALAKALKSQDSSDSHPFEHFFSSLWEDLTEPTKTVASGVLNEVMDLIGKIPLEDVRKVLSAIDPPHIQDPAGDELVQQTQDFRDTLSNVRALQAELSKLPPNDPSRAKVEKALGEASAKLTAMSGYTAKDAPKADTLWLDPQFLSRELPDGQVLAKNFPTGQPVTKPPPPLDFLFAAQPSRVFQLDGGQTSESKATIGTPGPRAYMAQVAKNRAAAGMPVNGGQPVGVHVSFQGGGGKGKRYASALSEMYSLGVVPTSLSGSSAGAIAAALAATGADPAELNRFVTNPELNKFFDIDLSPDDGGICDGNVAYQTIDEELRRLTGITDRPVTFADLKVPLHIYATKTSDSAPDAGTGDLSKVKNRIFVFSQETTPNTPVALAVRASMAIPGVFDPVEMVDPVSGRRMDLVDGGTIDNLPMEDSDGLPSVGITLLERDSDHPDATDNKAPRGPIPGGNLDATHIIWNAFNGYAMMKESGGTADDFKDRTQPKAGQFMLSVPVWNLKDPSQADSTLGFGYDSKVDPALDAQTHQVTRDFFKSVLGKLGDPTASASNVTAKLPKKVRFSDVPVTLDGKTYEASYDGGDSVQLTGADGTSHGYKLGQQKIEAMYLDNLSFHDLSSQLAYEIGSTSGGWFDWL